MNMKKIFSFAVTGAMAFSIMACSAQNVSVSSQTANVPQNKETPESVIITSLNAGKEETELRRLTILSALLFWIWLLWDILDALGMGDRVVGTADTSLDYLQKYIHDGIANLGTIKEADLEVCDGLRPRCDFYRRPSGFQL